MSNIPDEAIREIIKEFTLRPILNDDLRLKEDLGFDCLDDTTLVFELEEEFNIIIDDEISDAWETVRDVIDGVQKIEGE